MTDINLSHDDLTRYQRRGRLERAKAATALADAGIRALSHWAKHISADLARRRLRRETVRELRALSDRTLQDIGIPRSQIWAVAEHLVNAAGTETSDRKPRAPQQAGREPANQNQPADHRSAPAQMAVGCG